MAKIDETFSTMNGDTFFVKLKALLRKNMEMAFTDVVFEDKDGIYHPIKKIVIDQKMALAMITLKESEELMVGEHEI